MPTDASFTNDLTLVALEVIIYLIMMLVKLKDRYFSNFSCVFPQLKFRHNFDTKFSFEVSDSTGSFKISNL